jgi:hypothetical protein
MLNISMFLSKSEFLHFQHNWFLSHGTKFPRYLVLVLELLGNTESHVLLIIYSFSLLV